jgi:hypothetical protein
MTTNGELINQTFNDSVYMPQNGPSLMWSESYTERKLTATRQRLTESCIEPDFSVMNNTRNSNWRI